MYDLVGFPYLGITLQPSLRALRGGNARKALSNVMLMLTYFQVKESFICGICLVAVSPTI